MAEPGPKIFESVIEDILISDIYIGTDDEFIHGCKIRQWHVDELVLDIKRNGHLRPVVVMRRKFRGCEYTCIDGRHRISALKKLGATTVKAQIMGPKPKPKPEQK